MQEISLNSVDPGDSVRTECVAGLTCIELGLATPTDPQSPRCLVGLHKNLIKIPPDFHQGRQIVIRKASLWGVRNQGIEAEFRCVGYVLHENQDLTVPLLKFTYSYYTTLFLSEVIVAFQLCNALTRLVLHLLYPQPL